MLVLDDYHVMTTAAVHQALTFLLDHLPPLLHLLITTRSDQVLTRYHVLDDLVGAFFAVFVAVLGIAGTMIVSASHASSRTVSASVCSTTCISTCANAAPRQRR